MSTARSSGDKSGRVNSHFTLWPEAAHTETHTVFGPSLIPPEAVDISPRRIIEE